MKQKIHQILFGSPIKGEKLNKPTFRTIQASMKMEFNEWCKQIQVSILHDKASRRFSF
jgi:hypothetical protein